MPCIFLAGDLQEQGMIHPFNVVLIQGQSPRLNVMRYHYFLYLQTVVSEDLIQDCALWLCELRGWGGCIHRCIRRLHLCCNTVKSLPGGR